MIHKGSFSPDFFTFLSLAFLMASMQFFVNIGGVLDKNIFLWLIYNLSFIFILFLFLYSMIHELIKPHNPRDKEMRIGLNLVFVLLNMLFNLVIIIILKFYPSSSIFVLFTPFYLEILSLYCLISIIWYIFHYINRFRNGLLNVTKYDMLVIYLFGTPLGLLYIGALNVFYYSSSIIHSGTDYESTFILVFVLMGTVLSWIYQMNDNRTAYYYLDDKHDMPLEKKSDYSSKGFKPIRKILIDFLNKLM